jgi:NagD protein
MTTTHPIRRYAGYAFDFDGTVYLGGALLPGALRTIETLRSEGRRVVFISNNPTLKRADIAAKLTQLGLTTPPTEVINSTFVLVNYLRKRAPGATVFPISEEPLREELRAGGFTLSEEAEAIDFVIASFDRTFEYHKLQVAFDAVRAGARFIATNADRYCPVPGGGEPDAAAVIAAVEASTNTKIEVVVGKPSLIMGRTVLEVLGRPPEECLFTGDRLETDVLMGKRAGMDAALVLTGATSRADLARSKVRPDYVLEGLDGLLGR